MHIQTRDRHENQASKKPVTVEKLISKPVLLKNLQEILN